MMAEESENILRYFGVCPKCNRGISPIASEIAEVAETELNAIVFRCPHPDCSIVLGVHLNLHDPKLWKQIAEELRK
jgi:hypothetical protein